MISIIKYIVRLINYFNVFYNKLLFRYKKISYKSFPKINGKLFIRGAGKIVLGKNISINSSKSANAIGGDTRTIIYVAPKGILTIGDYSGISNCTLICNQQITIGKYVKIGGSVKIYDTDFHSLEFEKRKNKLTDIPNSKPIQIGDHCFIGAHSILLKGVIIGDKSIIGAGSVVTKSIPSGEIWAGNPARFIKKIDFI